MSCNKLKGIDVVQTVSGATMVDTEWLVLDIRTRELHGLGIDLRPSNHKHLVDGRRVAGLCEQLEASGQARHDEHILRGRLEFAAEQKDNRERAKQN